VSVKEIMKDLEKRMHGAVEVLHHEFKGLRTGRASTAMLEGVSVNYYGTDTPLNQVATLHVPEPSLIVIQPWDASLVATVEKAIMTSDLGLNPSNDGKVVRVPIPPLTEERRKEITKKAHDLAEHARTAIRQVRRDGNDKLKKMLKDHDISEDDEHRTLDEIQKLTDHFIEEIGEVLKHKEAEIMEV